MASFTDKQLFDRLWQAITTDGSGNPALRTVAASYAADSINDTHIDWGTGANQVSAADVPLEDVGTYFTTDNVEAALQQLAAAVTAGGAPLDSTYIVQVPSGDLTNEQALSALATGILKNTTTTGVLSIATAGTDYYAPGSTDVAVADGGTGASDASGARTNLGLAIGSDVQQYNANLAAIAGLTSAADKLPYFTGSGTAAVTAFTSYGRSLVDDADAATARTTLGLGTIATQAANSVSISGGSITGITDLTVADGGTGVSTLTGIVKGNGTSAFSAATEGTDYYAPGATDVALVDGGTGSSTASGARSNLGAAASGSNADITGLSAIALQAGVVLNPFNTSAGNTSEIRFLELAANGSNYVGFKASDALAGNVIWVLPIADGSAGQFLKTDGSKVLSWGSAGGQTSDKTADYSVLSGDSGTTFTNIGASGNVVFSLPTPAAGLEYSFIIGASQNVAVVPSGSTTIKYGPNLSMSSANVLASADLYSFIKMIGISSTVWVVESVIGWNMTQYGYILGGGAGSGTAVIDEMLIATVPTFTALSATLDTARIRVGGCYGWFNGYTGGGDTNGSTDSAVISKFAFAAKTEANLAATLDAACEKPTAGFQNGNTKGYFPGGGTVTSSAKVDNMDFAADTSANLGTDLTASRTAGACVQNGTTSAFYMGGGTTAVDRFTFSGETIAAITATLPASKQSQLPCWSGTKGYACGANGGPVATVQALTYSGETIAALGNNLPAAKEDGSGISSVLKGYVGSSGGSAAWYGLTYSAETWVTLGNTLSDTRATAASISTPAR